MEQAKLGKAKLSVKGGIVRQALLPRTKLSINSPVWNAYRRQRQAAIDPNCRILGGDSQFAGVEFGGHTFFGEHARSSRPAPTCAKY
jgi:hypothetical protein